MCYFVGSPKNIILFAAYWFHISLDKVLHKMGIIKCFFGFGFVFSVLKNLKSKIFHTVIIFVY